MYQTTASRTRHELLDFARAVKHQLSDIAVVEDVFSPAGLLVSMQRGRLTQLASPTLARTMACCQHLLETAGYGPDKLGGVLLVGGSSRIPVVTDVLEGRLGVGHRLARPAAVLPGRPGARGGARRGGLGVIGVDPADHRRAAEPRVAAGPLGHPRRAGDDGSLAGRTGGTLRLGRRAGPRPAHRRHPVRPGRRGAGQPHPHPRRARHAGPRRRLDRDHPAFRARAAGFAGRRGPARLRTQQPPVTARGGHRARDAHGPRARRHLRRLLPRRRAARHHQQGRHPAVGRRDRPRGDDAQRAQEPGRARLRVLPRRQAAGHHRQRQDRPDLGRRHRPPAARR